MCEHDQPFWKDAEKGPFDQNQKRLLIPTYNPESDVEYDYSQAREIVLQEDVGLRIVLGDPADMSVPDVAIERGVGCWRIFVNTGAHSDPLCIIEISPTQATISTDRTGEPPLLVEALTPKEEEPHADRHSRTTP